MELVGVVHRSKMRDYIFITVDLNQNDLMHYQGSNYNIVRGDWPEVRRPLSLDTSPEQLEDVSNEGVSLGVAA